MVELVGLPVVDLMAGLAEAVAMGDALLAEAEGMGNATAKVPWTSRLDCSIHSGERCSIKINLQPN